MTNSRAKGKRGELEVIHILRDCGWRDARRTSDGRTQCSRGDVVNGPKDVHIEIKLSETVRIWEWIGQAEGDARPTDMAIVAFRRSRSKWYGVVDLEDLLGLLHELHELRGAL